MSDDSSSGMTAIVAIIAIIVVVAVGYVVLQKYGTPNNTPSINVNLPK